VYLRRAAGNDDYSAGEQAQGDKPFLPIIETLIKESDAKPGQHQFGVGKIQAILGEVAAAFRLVPLVYHPIESYFCNYMPPHLLALRNGLPNSEFRCSDHFPLIQSGMDLRYPVGPCEYPAAVSPEARTQHINDLAALPERLRAAVHGLNDRQLDTPYRPGGWTVRQVVHHFADSHMNAYVRFRLALTEPQPTIKSYDEKTWAELPDSRTAPIESSLRLLEGLHQRWVIMFTALDGAGFSRTLHHPEIGVVRLDTYLASYGWHCRHHVAHIISLRQRSGWD
jgi:hypothetical protein